MIQLVYRIQKKDPNILLVTLEEKGSKRILYLDHLKAITTQADRDALAFLIPIHLRSANVSRNSDTTSFQRIEVGAAQSYTAILLMAKTGRLFFEQKLLSYSPLPLPLTWKGEKLSERSCTVSAYLGETPLHEADLLFPGTPYWAISKRICQPISTELSWTWIEKGMKGPLLLEGAQQKKFLEEDPPIAWAVQQEIPIIKVFPQLVLQDSTGCFAHLWMNYPTIGRIAFEDLCPTVGGKARLKQEELLWEKDLVEAGYLRKIVGATRYFCPGDQVFSTLQFLLELGWELIDHKGRNVLCQTGCNVSVREQKEHIAISAKVKFQQDKEALFSTLSHRLWVELDENSVGLIDYKALEPISKVFQEGVLEGDLLLLDRQKIALLSSWAQSPEVQWEEALKESVTKMSLGIEEALADPSFKATLLPYQQKGLDWIAHLYALQFSGLLADEMGLGKTVQVLAFFSRLRTKLPILVVAPTSLLLNWSRECARFLPHLPVYIHSGKDRSQDPLALQAAPMIITSYAILRLDEALLRQVHFEVILLDESQAIKNSQTQTAKAAFALRGKFRLCLSGTPIENRIEEFVSQFQFLLPGLLAGADSLDLIKRKSRPFFLRRRKADVALELPEKIEQIMWIEMTEQQELMYERYQSELKKGLLHKVAQDGASMHRMEILEAILRLRQICCDPRLLGESFMGAKSELLKEELGQMLLEGRKVLVYSQFTSLLLLLKQDLAEYRPLYLDGSMGYEERGREVQKFQEDPNSSLFLLSLKAGGAGLNLTAADTVILFDPWWNEAVELQAVDRAHRMGQTKNVLAKRYLIPHSIEEKMLLLKEKKQFLSDQLLSDAKEAFNWTAEDLLHLLS
ncbi:MAG: DEAD/DEAH box helicase [Chlamydiales bacterium]|nr:DEAD/DEAH box helicase [Chlamydiales bacterium]